MKSWLPDEITRAEPYSMGPLLRWAPLSAVPQLPAAGVARMDVPEFDIAHCLHAPRAIQRAARAQGINHVIMMYPAGIEKVNPAIEPTRARLERLAAERAGEAAR